MRFGLPLELLLLIGIIQEAYAAKLDVTELEEQERAGTTIIHNYFQF